MRREELEDCGGVGAGELGKMSARSGHFPLFFFTFNFFSLSSTASMARGDFSLRNRGAHAHSTSCYFEENEAAEGF